MGIMSITDVVLLSSHLPSIVFRHIFISCSFKHFLICIAEMVPFPFTQETVLTWQASSILRNTFITRVLQTSLHALQNFPSFHGYITFLHTECVNKWCFRNDLITVFKTLLLYMLYRTGITSFDWYKTVLNTANKCF